MTIAIRQVRIIEGQGRTIERGTVVIEGDRISAAGPEKTTPVPRGR
jgi:imidazolonepropionase-like amidohydrolase